LTVEEQSWPTDRRRPERTGPTAPIRRWPSSSGP